MYPSSLPVHIYLVKRIDTDFGRSNHLGPPRGARVRLKSYVNSQWVFVAADEVYCDNSATVTATATVTVYSPSFLSLLSHSLSRTRARIPSAGQRTRSQRVLAPVSDACTAFAPRNNALNSARPRIRAESEKSICEPISLSLSHAFHFNADQLQFLFDSLFLILRTAFIVRTFRHGSIFF